jgi:hypothetical protein
VPVTAAPEILDGHRGLCGKASAYKHSVDDLGAAHLYNTKYFADLGHDKRCLIGRETAAVLVD